MDNLPEPLPLPPNPRFIDLTKQQFERLTVLYFVGQDKWWTSRWLCRCNCGNHVVVVGQCLRRGDSKSCGCLKGERGRAALVTHGLGKPSEYAIWQSAKARCFDASSHNYPRYGGRGITMCDRWRNSFANFLSDMGPRPSKHHSIERLDNNQGYTPDNCCWATTSQQARNRRSNRMLTYQGVTQPAVVWAEQNGIPHKTLLNRIYRGWTVEKAIEVPLR